MQNKIPIPHLLKIYSESSSEQLIRVAKMLDDSSDVNESKWHVPAHRYAIAVLSIQRYMWSRKADQVRKNIFAAL